MKITIIGAGNGGLSFGANLIKLGAEVNLFDKFPQIIKPIIENNNGIDMEQNSLKGTYKFNKVTDNLEEVIRNSKYILVITPAFAHAQIAKELAKYVHNDQRILLLPGRTGGALEVKKIMEQHGKDGVIVAEAETLLYACRKTSPIEVKIYGEKNKVGLASLPSTAIDEIISDLKPFIPNFFPYPNVFYSSLNNIGAVFHPTPFLLNLGRSDSGVRYKYYHEGITPNIGKLLEELDKERLLIAKKLSINLPTALEWLNENYSLSEANLYDAIQSNQSYKEIFAPTSIDSRYILEDVPMSLVPLTEIAQTLSVKTPIMDSVVNLASAVYNIDFRITGRNITKMGIEGKVKSTDVNEMSLYVKV